MTPEVVVVGGGYAGIAVAQALDDSADVILIEPRDHFVHNVGLLRALVAPDFAKRITFPYDRLLQRGTVVRDRVTDIRPHAVTGASGTVYEPDFIVLATGSAYPFPAKMDGDSTEEFFDRLSDAHRALRKADHPLLLGAGPVGIELAGEITSAWPGKRVTLLDPADHIIAGPYDHRLRSELTEQLDRRGVRLVLGDSLREFPDLDAGTYGNFAVRTTAGMHFEADTWFRCFGAKPVTEYLDARLRGALTPTGRIAVAAGLQVVGHDTIFAVGDVTDVDEPKRAAVARGHAATVAQNISALAAGGVSSAEYVPPPHYLTIPLGPDGGAGYDAREGGKLLGPEAVAQDKGKDLKVDAVAAQFGFRSPRL